MLNRLWSCLKRCKNFVEEFSGRNWFKKLVCNVSDPDTFKTLNQELSKCAQDLNLGLNIEQIFNQERFEQARKSDLDEISRRMNEIAQLLMDDLQAQFQQQEKKFDEVLEKRLESFLFNLKQNLAKARNDEKAKALIAEEEQFLHISLNDLFLERRIGAGGFADVHLGTWLSRHQEVAIKTIRIPNIPTDDIRKKFVKEISLMQSIHYEHVLRCWGACLEPSYYALILEYMPLGSLYDVLQNEKEFSLSWNDRWSIALQMTKGINYLHLYNPPILHRDVKSMNFLMTEGKNGFIVKVGDFGLSVIRRESLRQSVQPPVGSLAWHAPELLLLEGTHSIKTDIYALGITFWEVATRREPYVGIEA
ncbi:unnamed protein product, partial [Rotaria sp. Silwood1]